MTKKIKYGQFLCGEDSGQICRTFQLIILLGTLPCIGLSIYAWGSRILLLMLASLVPAMIIETLFSRFRKTPLKGSSFVFSFLLVLLLPASTPLGLVFIASAFGIFFGQEIFGGSGFQLVSPVLLAKLFLMIGYLPEIQGPFFASAADPDNTRIRIVAALLMLLPLIMQIVVRPLNLYILGGAAGGTLLCLLWMASMDILPYDSVMETLILDSFAFVICFFLFDPACAPSRKWPMLIYGFIVAALAFVIGTFSDKYAEGIIIAMLFGNITAPLLDQLFNRSEPVRT